MCHCVFVCDSETLTVCVYVCPSTEEEKGPVMSGGLSRVSELLESHTTLYPQSLAATHSDRTADWQAAEEEVWPNASHY